MQVTQATVPAVYDSTGTMPVRIQYCTRGIIIVLRVRAVGSPLLRVVLGHARYSYSYEYDTVLYLWLFAIFALPNIWKTLFAICNALCNSVHRTVLHSTVQYFEQGESFEHPKAISNLKVGWLPP